MSLIDLYKKGKKKLEDTFEPVEQKVSSGLRGIANNAKNYFKNDATVGGIVKNTFSPSTLSNSLMNAPKYDFAEKVNWLPKKNDGFGKRVINNPITKVGATLGQGALNSFHSTRDYAKEASDQYYGNSKPDTKKLVGMGLESSLDLGGLLSGGETGKELVTSGLNATKKTIGKNIWQGVKDTSKVMGRYGAGYGMADALENDDDMITTAKKTAGGYATGRATGALIGGTIPAMGGAVTGIKNEAKNIAKDIANYKNPYAKRVVREVKTVPTGAFAPGGIEQRIEIPETERKYVEKIKIPFKPESFTGKFLNKEITINPGLTIKATGKAPSTKVMSFDEKIALKNKQAQELVSKQQENQRLQLDKAEKGFVPPQNVKSPAKTLQELMNNEDAVRVYQELDTAEAGKRIMTRDYEGYVGEFIGVKSSFPKWVPEHLRSRELFNKVQESMGTGIIPKTKKVKELYDVVVEEIIKRRGNIDSPFNGDEFASKPEIKIKKNNSLGLPEGGFNEYQQRAYKAKGERVNAIREIIDYPKELRAIGYVKKETDRIGKNEASRIIKLGKLGYPKNEIQKMDFDRMDLIINRNVPWSSLKDYYQRKHALDTNYLQDIDPAKLNDISPLMAGGRDVYRNFETVFNNDFPKIKERLLDPFDRAKGQFITDQEDLLNELNENIIKRFGIAKGSIIDKAVVNFGEGKIGLDELRQQFPKDWKKIVAADKWFQSKYSKLLDDLNMVREAFFPTHPLYPESTKVIPKRKDYYRHGQNFDGFKGLMNMFENPSSIDPSLAVTSDVTNPKTKWLSFAQRRKGTANELGAVEGYLDYIRNHAYARNIDPYIQKFKGVDDEAKGALGNGEFFHETTGLAEELSKKMDPIQKITDSKNIQDIKKVLVANKVSEIQADWMAKELAEIDNYQQTKNFIKNKTSKNKENVLENMGFKSNAEVSENKLNNFLVFMKNYSRDLAGKTNPIDRPFQENIFGRKALNIIDFANKRFKANAVLGNLSSTMAQFFNIPQGFASAGLRNSAKGIGRSLADVFSDKSPIGKSDFIKERYFNKYDQFDEGVLANTKKFAMWMTSVGDKIGTKFIWNSHYQKALSGGIANPIKYADDWTRKMVAGRGVGEVPIAQKSKLIQMTAPFQLEVANMWYALRDIAKNDPRKIVIAKKMMEFTVASYLMNRVVKEVRGSDVSFDPFNAMMEAYEEYQNEENKLKGAIKAGGRMAGEVVSNIPGGQTVASMYPEYGEFMGQKILPPRKEFFGEGDPTRFGTGGLPMFNAIKNPITGFAMPYGGKQLEKTVGGARTLLKGYAENKAGKVMTPVEGNIPNIVKGLMFGKNSLREVKKYYDDKQTPLSDLQTEKFKMMGNDKNYFNSVMNERKSDNEIQAMKSGKGVTENGQLSDGMYQLSNGSVYVKSLNREFKNVKQAQVAMAKDELENSDNNFMDLGDVILRKTSDGTVTSQRKDGFLVQLNSAKLTNLKKNKDLENWNKVADEQYQILNKMLNDPTIDELDKTQIQNKIDTLEIEFSKYKSYGAFTKGKKGKEVKSVSYYKNANADPIMLTIAKMRAFGKNHGKLMIAKRMPTFNSRRVSSVRRKRGKLISLR